MDKNSTKKTEIYRYLITAGLYILNIVDANVDAHLLQFNVNDDLSLKPDLQTNPYNFKQNVGFSINVSILTLL